MLLIIRGQKVLKLQKMDYTEHPDAKYLKLEKTNAHIPEWYREMEAEKKQLQILEDEKTVSEVFETERAEEIDKQEMEPLTLKEEQPQKVAGKKEKQVTVYKV